MLQPSGQQVVTSNGQPASAPSHTSSVSQAAAAGRHTAPAFAAGNMHSSSTQKFAVQGLSSSQGPPHGTWASTTSASGTVPASACGCGPGAHAPSAITTSSPRTIGLLWHEAFVLRNS